MKQVLDHVGIYLLIAGSYSPFMVRVCGAPQPQSTIYSMTRLQKKGRKPAPPPPIIT